MDMGIDLELCPLAMFKHDIDAYCSDTYNMTAEVRFLNCQKQSCSGKLKLTFWPVFLRLGNMLAV